MKNVLGALVLVTAALLLPSVPVQAQTDPDLCSRENPAACLNGVSGSVTSLDALRVSVTAPRGCTGAAARANPERKSECDTSEPGGTKTKSRLDRTHVAAAQGASGLLAEPSGWALWASYGRSRFEGTVSVAPYTADLDSVRIGADRAFGQRYVGGLAFAAERMDTKTRFNGGGQDSDAYMVIPYFLIMLNENFSIDLNAGFGKNKVDQDRIDPANGAKLESSYDGQRRFWSVTLNGSRNFGNWVLGGRAGYLDSRENQDKYTETGGPSVRAVGDRRLKLAQVSVGVDAAYQLPNNFEPYASIILRQDVRRNDGSEAGGLPGNVGNTQPDDKNGVDWTLGLRFYAQRGITGSAEFVQTEGRDRFRHKTVNLLVRIEL